MGLDHLLLRTKWLQFLTGSLLRLGSSMVTFLSQTTHCLFITVKTFWGFSSVGRASDLHSEGQEFEPPSLQFASAVIAQLVRARH